MIFRFLLLLHSVSSASRQVERRDVRTYDYELEKVVYIHSART